MDFRQLNAFLTIGKLQSFTAAASSLDYAQATVTTQIKLLEEELKEYVSFIDPKGGLTFYIKLKNKEINSEELFYRLKERKLYITPGSIFYTGNDEGHYSFRIRYSQVKEEDIRRGINIIKEELDKCRI